MRNAKRRTKRKQPKIEDHLPGPDDGRWSGRRNITIWLQEDIIERCKPHPASQLRIWIEENFPRE